ncbi:uncharacterized protein METZ01_LOCUS351719, partial [marine metagenome]
HRWNGVPVDTGRSCCYKASSAANYRFFSRIGALNCPTCHLAAEYAGLWTSIQSSCS